jgi:hypothetical protein
MFYYQLAIQINENETAKIVSDYNEYIWSLPNIVATSIPSNIIADEYTKYGIVSLKEYKIPFNTTYIIESDITHWYEISFYCSDLEEALGLEYESINQNGVHPNLILEFFVQTLRSLNNISKVHLGLIGVEIGAMYDFDHLRMKMEGCNDLIFINRIDLNNIHKANGKFMKFID